MGRDIGGSRPCFPPHLGRYMWAWGRFNQRLICLYVPYTYTRPHPNNARGRVKACVTCDRDLQRMAKSEHGELGLCCASCSYGVDGIPTSPSGAFLEQVYLQWGMSSLCMSVFGHAGHTSFSLRGTFNTHKGI